MHNIQENRLYLNEKFTYTDHSYIQSIIPQMTENLIIDFTHCTYMDSGALGLLLIIQEKIQGVTLYNPSPIIDKILKIANFHQLFPINYQE